MYIKRVCTKTSAPETKGALQPQDRVLCRRVTKMWICTCGHETQPPEERGSVRNMYRVCKAYNTESKVTTEIRYIESEHNSQHTRESHPAYNRQKKFRKINTAIGMPKCLLSFGKHFCFAHIEESTRHFRGPKSSGRYHTNRGQVPSGHKHTYRGRVSSGHNHTYRGRVSSGHYHKFDIPRSRVQRSMSGIITSAADAVKGPAVNATRPA